MEKNGKIFHPMDINTVLQILDKNNVHFERMLVRERFAINLDMSSQGAPIAILNQLRTPYHIKDNRILRALSGKAKVEINFEEYDVVAGDVIMIRENSYFEIKEFSENSKAEIIVFIPERYQTDLQMYGKPLIRIHPPQKNWEEIGHLFYTIYSFALIEPYRKELVEPIIAALANEIVRLASEERHGGYKSGMELLFNRFIDELNDSKAGKLPVCHYAERLCVTPQYLSKAVSTVSGFTVSQWINKSIVTKARILLLDRNNSVASVADTLNFPNDSFFCRFFKRETGLTPSQYRIKNM